METELLSVKENPLLDRSELEVEIDHEGESTPSKEDVKSRVVAENDLNEEKVEVESVHTGYGSQSSRASLKVYQDFEYDEQLEKEPEEDQTPEKDVSVSEEYEEIVSGTITDAKESLKEMESPNFDQALKAEKQNKNRKTLVEWLESRK